MLVIMGFHKTFPLLIVLFFVDFNYSPVISSGVSPHSTAKEDGHRQTKQLFLPIPLWPYPRGGFVQDSFPLLSYPFQSSNLHYHQPSNIILTRYIHPHDLSTQEITTGKRESGAATGIPCIGKGNRRGKCRPFSECFPMLEFEYGNHENGTGNYMDLPLTEELLSNTNSTLCSQHDDLKHQVRVCCPTSRGSKNHIPEHRAVSNYVGVDVEVEMPAITQRPPLTKLQLLSRQLNTAMCGQSVLHGKPTQYFKARPKVTGGQEARSPLEFPWMVAVFGKNRKIFCGASLITDRFLLSAAHCFSTFTPKDIPHLYVHLGDFNLRTTSDGPHIVRRIEKIILNKKFNIDNYHNDIALIRLDTPVNFTDRVHPICLPEPSMDSLEKQEIVVTGWGRKYRWGTTTDILRKVEMPVWSLRECKRVYSTFAPGRVLDSNICAGDGKRDKDACLGDSGGPAIAYAGNKWIQVGITSWGKGCGSFPGVYTRVDKYLMWITKNLNQYA